MKAVSGFHLGRRPWILIPPWLAVASAFAAPSPPVFLAHPAGSTIPLGSNVTLKVVVRADPPAGFQWYRNTVPVPGATTPELALTALTLATAGQYNVIATNALGSAESATAVVNADIQPDPRSLGLLPEVTVFAGGSASFDAATTGTEPIKHSWFLNGNIIPAATTRMLTVSSARPADQGRYFYSAQGPVNFNTAFSDLAVIPPESAFSRRGLGSVKQVASIEGGGYAAAGESVFWILKAGVAGVEGVDFSEFGPVTQVIGDGPRLFRVALNDKVIKVLDVSNPQLPAVVSSYQPSPLFSATLKSAESRWPLVYFALGDLGLHIVDFSNPASPSMVGSFLEVGKAVMDVDLKGNTAVVANATGGLVLLDVSNPAALSVLGRSPAFKFAYRTVLRGGDALVDSGASEIHLYDLSNPSLPVVKSTMPLSSTANDMQLRGDQLFVAEDQKIEVFDLAAPAPSAPSFVYEVQAKSICLSGDNLIVANLFGGVVGLGLPNTPSVIGVSPATQQVGLGGEARMLVNSVGAPPLRYQWFKGSSPILNATNASLRLTVADASFATLYHVDVSNKDGTASSQEVQVQLDSSITAPEVETLSAGPVYLKLGQTTKLSAAVTGQPTPGLQWLSNGIAVPGANALQLDVGPLPANAKATYQLKASNPAGDKTGSGVLVMTVPDTFPKLSLSIVGGRAEVRSSDGLGFKWLLKSSTNIREGAVWSLTANRILSNQNQLLVGAATNLPARFYRLELP